MLFIHLFLSPLLFLRNTTDAFEYSKVTLLSLMALVLAALAISAWLGEPARKFPWREYGNRLKDLFGDPVGWGVLLFTASALISTVFSLSSRTSWRGSHGSEFGLLTVLCYAILFFGTRAYCQTVADRRRLVTASVCAAALASAYALIQFFRLDPIGWTSVSVFGPYVRPFATMGHPNHLAAYLVLAFPLIFFRAHEAVVQRHYLTALAYAVVGIAACVVVVISISRGAWLALAGTIAVLACGWLCLGRGRQIFTVLVVLAALSVMAVVAVGCLTFEGRQLLISVLARVRHLGDAAGRQHIWPAAVAVFREHPLLGCGPDCFSLAFMRQRTVAFWLTEWNALPLRVHNEGLQVLATQGLVGGLAMLLLVVGLVRSAIVAWNRCAMDRKFLVAICAAMTGFFLQGFFNFTVAGTGSLFMTFAALLAGMARSTDQTEPSASPQGRDPWFITVLVVAHVLAAAVFLHNVGPDAVALGRGQWLGVIALAITAVLVIGAVARCEPAPAVPAVQARVHSRSRTVFAHNQKCGAVFRRLVLPASVWLGAGLIAIYGILVPAQANIACRTGELLLAKDPGLAQTEFARAVALAPKCDFYWGRMAAAVQLRAKAAPAPEKIPLLQRSRQAFVRAIALVPVNAYYHVGLARVLIELARQHVIDSAGAFQEYDQALALEPSNPYYLVDAANAALVLNDLARAREYALRGRELYPNFGPLQAHLGYVAMVQQRFEEAAALLREAVASEWYGDEAGRQFAAGKLNDALTALGRITAQR